MSDSIQYGTLEDALKAMKIPLENIPWIRAYTSHIGITAYIGTGSYLKAVRADGGPDLRIAYGWTTGFTSPEELSAALGEYARGSLDTWREERSGLWGITHPVNRGYDAGKRARRSVERERAICPECFMQVAETGVCSTCDD